MGAIYKRELKSYFTSPIGYVLLAIFACTTAIYFVVLNLLNASSDLSSLFSFIIMWIMMLYAPILTMKLMSEEKKLKTDQLLLTSPVSLTSIVIGKFLSALTMFAISVSVTLLYAVVTFIYGEPGVAMLIGNYIALLLVGAAFIAVGLFISSLTENQVVAAFGAFGSVLLLLLLNAVASSVNNPTLSAVLNWLSIYSRYTDFTMGVFNISAIVYYLSFAAVFLFLTVRVLEKRRWA